jgi:hypothetical protein
MKRMISLLLVVVLVSGCGKQLNKSQPEPDKTYTQNDEPSAPSLPKSAILQMGLVITITFLFMFTIIGISVKYNCCFEKIEKEVSSSSSLASLSYETQEEEESA